MLMFCAVAILAHGFVLKIVAIIVEICVVIWVALLLGFFLFVFFLLSFFILFVYDTVDTFLPRGSKQRQWYEADICWKIENVIAQEGVQRGRGLSLRTGGSNE